jgi:ferredoxin
VNVAACLSARYPGYDCGLCVSACPVAAITLEGGKPVPREECLGCGQCATACPSSALAVDGFALPSQSPGDAAANHIDCWRVAASESPRGALRVPCLAGIGTGWLLALFDRTGERPIRLLDRGGCATCPVGGGMVSLRATVMEARTLLTECGVAADALPELVVRPGRQPLAPAIPASSEVVPKGRRGFFRDLIGAASRAAVEVRGSSMPEGPTSFRQPILPVERMRTVTALTRITARHGRPVPARALPQLSLAECGAHGLCAGICPTGALHQHEGEGALALGFHGALCISCGQCARACPDQAITLSPFGGRAVSDVLARWTARECPACGNTFFGGADGLCRGCAKEVTLQHGMAVLFRPTA